MSQKYILILSMPNFGSIFDKVKLGSKKFCESVLYDLNDDIIMRSEECKIWSLFHCIKEKIF